MQPYEGVTLAMPGRHAEDTTPKGGDFVVMVADKNCNWKNHQFKHDDIFKEIRTRRLSSAIKSTDFMAFYLKVIADGVDPLECTWEYSGLGNVMNPIRFFCAIQCLAVAEHRRYAKHEPKFGGRFLPFRFAAGIAEGLWTVEEAIEKQKYGRPAVERLEKEKGLPALSKELMHG